MAVIIVTGTPGTGKTEVAKYLAERLHGTYVYCGELFTEESVMNTDADGTQVIDTGLFVKHAEEFITQHKDELLIIDGHLSHYIHKDYVDLCVVVKCDISVLKKRLEERNYHEEKIRTNMDSEILDICLTEAQEIGHSIRIIDATQTFEKTKQELKDLKV